MSAARRDRPSCRPPGARRTAGRVALLAAVLCAGLGTAKHVAAAIVRLHPQARATGPVVRLGDVADVLDPQPETVDRLRRLELAPAPAAGGRLVLDYSAIRSRLEVLGVDLSRTDFSGSTRIEVLSGVAQAPESNDGPVRRHQAEANQKRAERVVAEAIERSVRQRDPSVGRVTAEVRFSAEESERLLAVSGRGFDVRGGRAPWDAPQEFVLQYLDEREQPRFFTVACRLVRVPSVLAARYALPKGYVLREADLVWRDADVPGPVATRLEEVVGRETRKTLREGEPIVLDAVQQVPLIRSGDIVTVSARRPGITVRRQLKSRGDGAVGETVTLVTLDGRQQLLARVTGYHEAEAIGGDGADVGGGLPTDRVRFVRSDEGTTGGVRDVRSDLRRPASN